MIRWILRKSQEPGEFREAFWASSCVGTWCATFQVCGCTTFRVRLLVEQTRRTQEGNREERERESRETREELKRPARTFVCVIFILVPVIFLLFGWKEKTGEEEEEENATQSSHKSETSRRTGTVINEHTRVTKRNLHLNRIEEKRRDKEKNEIFESKQRTWFENQA